MKHSSELIQKYCDLLLKWNRSINLIGRTTEKDVLERHIQDCLQLLDYIPDKDISIADLGTGAGLPGVLLSIGGCKNLDLIESDQKKCVFLKEVKRQLGLDYHIITQRIENIADKRYDLIVSRALASLDKLFNYAEPIMRENGYLLLLKGENFLTEIEEAKRSWIFSYNTIPSKTGCGGVILEVQNIKRR